VGTAAECLGGFVARRYRGPVYVACEGPGDCEFVRKLLEQYGLTGFDVGCPSDTAGPAGKGGLRRHLEGLVGSTDAPKIRSLAVIADNDDRPEASVKAVKAALSGIGYDVADPPGILVADRRVGVYMIPGIGIPGTLEHLLLEAVFDAHANLRACVDEFCSCTVHPLGWSSNAQAKMRLQTLIAAHCEDNPGVPLRWIWAKERKWSGGNPIPIESNRFSELVSFLRQFAS